MKIVAWWFVRCCRATSSSARAGDVFVMISDQAEALSVLPSLSLRGRFVAPSVRIGEVIILIRLLIKLAIKDNKFLA